MIAKGVIAVCGVMLPLVAFGQVLWDQEPGADGNGYASDGISTNGSQYWSQALADDFTLSSASTITDIEFWGGSENYTTSTLSNFSAFDIYVYDANFNVLFSTQVATGSLNPVDTGGTNLNGGEIYSLDLASSIDLGAGTYYLHVGSINVDPQADGFFWSDNLTGDDSLALNDFDGNGWQTTTGADFAFKLYGTPDTPEPVSLSLFAVGGLALLRRRKS